MSIPLLDTEMTILAGRTSPCNRDSDNDAIRMPGTLAHSRATSDGTISRPGGFAEPVEGASPGYWPGIP